MPRSKTKIESARRGFFRFRELGDMVVVTNDAGQHITLDKADFDLLSAGNIGENNKNYLDLKAMGCIHSGDGEPSPVTVEKFKRRNMFIYQGPLLFIVIPTLRCNMKCAYCHASACGPKAYDYDMSIETAKRVVDTIFESPGINFGIEFQGGEPMLHWEAVKFTSNYAIERNKMHKRNLQLTIVSNLSLMDDEKLEFLISRKIGVCTSLDGPAFVHNKNRGGGHARLIKNIKNIMRRYKVEFDRYTPGALTTITRHSLPFHKEIVDSFVDLGMEGIHLRHYNPIGSAQSAIPDIGYSPEEFLDFYAKALDYIIDLNKQGTLLIDRTAWLFLLKILGEFDPNFMDLRSPCGAGIGQIAFNYDGSVYTCDEGRMLAMQGDESFLMGNVRENNYDELVGAEIVKQTCLASILDGIPRCCDCAYKPYCGVCPLLNYVEEGSLFAKIPQNRRHKINQGVLDIVFTKLQDESSKKVFINWLERGINVV
ncbi:MAG: His-Xaa-Ser system radical SAM maturase HxsB [bacterium]